ncbi:twin-arginine translocase TatA/TatE family subunit [Cellvibrio sp. pealriver]|uniref:twin-arginine translocase TatA/TatE family subunit n=1 Tax=Cellvibrio sp. pealriver TaxID=1622269 RepID=UPI00066FC8CC|nr:twin-arginine translocase TatA/TatE family subunit [Cellvibrio sp. pealriver]
MGISGISIWQLLIILAIVVMLFGTKRLRSLGSDLGSMIKGFKSSMNNDEAKKDEEDPAQKMDPKSLDQKTTSATAAGDKVDQNNTKV